MLPFHQHISLYFYIFIWIRLAATLFLSKLYQFTVDLNSDIIQSSSGVYLNTTFIRFYFRFCFFSALFFPCSRHSVCAHLLCKRLMGGRRNQCTISSSGCLYYFVFFFLNIISTFEAILCARNVYLFLVFFVACSHFFSFYSLT